MGGVDIGPLRLRLEMHRLVHEVVDVVETFDAEALELVADVVLHDGGEHSSRIVSELHLNFNWSAYVLEAHGCKSNVMDRRYLRSKLYVRVDDL